MHLKAPRKRPFLSKMIFSLILAGLLTLLILFFMRKDLKDSLKEYATLESKQFAKAVLNQATQEAMRQNHFTEEPLYEVEKNKNDEITSVDFNTIVANEILSQITEEVTKQLLLLENGNLKNVPVNQSFQGVHFKKYQQGVVCEIPLGLFTNHFFFGNLGLVIPIRFSFVGTMDANLKSKITPYGINNALVELYILVEITEKITMPLSSDEVKVDLEIPFVTQMITGKVPTYYQGGWSENSNILSIPLNSDENQDDL